MAVARVVAVISAQLDLIMKWRYDDNSTLFDPFEVSQVEIIDSDTGAVLQTIASGSITKIADGKYQVTTASSWNTTPRTIVDRWTYKKVSTSVNETLEGATVISQTSGLPIETSIVTLADMKDYLRLTTGTYDDLLNLLLGKATSFVESLMNRIITETTYTELYDGNNENELILDKSPIGAVNVLSLDIDKELKKYDNAIVANEILIHDDIGTIELYNESFIVGQKNIYIDYDAGYAAADIPPDLKLIVMDLCAKKFKDTEGGRFGITSKNVMAENVTFIISEITSGNRAVIEKHRLPARRRGVSVSGWTAA